MIKTNLENSMYNSNAVSQRSKIKRVLNVSKNVWDNVSVFLTLLLASLSHKLFLWNSCIMRKVRYILKNNNMTKSNLENSWDNIHAISQNSSHMSKKRKQLNASKRVSNNFIIIVYQTILGESVFQILKKVGIFECEIKFLFMIQYLFYFKTSMKHNTSISAKSSFKNKSFRNLFVITLLNIIKFLIRLVLKFLIRLVLKFLIRLVLKFLIRLVLKFLTWLVPLFLTWQVPLFLTWQVPLFLTWQVPLFLTWQVPLFLTWLVPLFLTWLVSLFLTWLVSKVW